jgi:Na+/H+ antiporter NhaC
MSRIISTLIVLALFGALFLLPGADPAQLGALQVGDLLAKSSESGPTHAELILGSQATSEGPQESQLSLRMGEVVVRGVNGAPMPDEVNAAARRSLLAGLRQTLADIMGEWAAMDEPARATDRGVLLSAIAAMSRASADASTSLIVNGEQAAVPDGASFELITSGGDWSANDGERILLYDAGSGFERSRLDWRPPSRSSLIPPLIAIALAVLLRKPVLALGIGVLTGTMLVGLHEGGGVFMSTLMAPVDFVAPYFWGELLDQDRQLIIGFVVAMLAMIGVLSRSGGIQGLMDHIARYATNVKQTQIVTWFLGLLVFFDDYTNTIICGATMRPLTDRFRISREKLTYLVDSTAAPVAGLMIVSTWIAFEVSTFSNQLPAAGLLSSDGYTVFIETLPYRFYCLFTIFFVGLIVFSGRDFGPMLKAEIRARTKGQLLRPGGQPMVSEEGTALEPAPGVKPAAWRALVPLGAFLAVTGYVILNTGGAFNGSIENLWSITGLKDMLGNASSSLALFQGSVVGLILACLVSLTAGLTDEIPKAAWTTLRSMGVAVVILYLAWMVAAVCGDLGTASYLTALLGDSMPPGALPMILFLLAGLVSFATGTSWGTMGILLPLVVGLSYTIGEGSDVGGHLLMVMSIGAVLEGSIFGDHCSPISDTTVLSSVACAADHVDHVRTQAPYALVTMGTGLVVGYLPCAFFGMSPFLGLVLGMACLTAIVFLFGKKADDSAAVPDEDLFVI